MLVYAKNPKGVLHLPSRKRVYGAATGHAPVDVSTEEYDAYSGCFVDATYRARELEQIFGKPFTPVAFKVSELSVLPYSVLYTLASEIGVVRGCGAPRRNLAASVKTALMYGETSCRMCNKRFVINHASQFYCTKRCQRRHAHLAKR